MKKLITILLFLLTLNSYGQTKLDSLIFYKVNEYRIENGLSPWVWENKVFLIAEKHNTYQLKISDISHKESQDVENHEEINRLSYRFDSVFTNWLRCAENVAVVNTRDMTLEESATATLEMWISSPPHHKALLAKRFKAGAVSSHHSTKWSQSKYADNKSWIYVTLNIYGSYLSN